MRFGLAGARGMEGGGGKGPDCFDPSPRQLAALGVPLRTTPFGKRRGDRGEDPMREKTIHSPGRDAVSCPTICTSFRWFVAPRISPPYPPLTRHRHDASGRSAATID